MAVVSSAIVWKLFWGGVSVTEKLMYSFHRKLGALFMWASSLLITAECSRIFARR